MLNGYKRMVNNSRRPWRTPGYSPEIPQRYEYLMMTDDSPDRTSNAEMILFERRTAVI